ncbi:proline transporter 3-like [Physcomitrium patens]|uniref:proline transporter 3-like n=1 Tax=Physcomitrium patens TaxID=3218 RepID=UPI003CCE0FC8
MCRPAYVPRNLVCAVLVSLHRKYWNHRFFFGGGESLKAIAAAFTVGRHVTLPGWVGVAGAVICVFAFLVPTLHAFRFFSTCSLLLSCVYIFTSVGIALTDGVKAKFSRDYSLKGSNTEKAFNALGAMATIAFAFNTGILPEMQATVKEPSVRNMKKALDLQFTVGTLPILMLTFVGYWAYGNDVVPYMLNSVSGPKSAVTVANAAAFLQTVVSLHIYCSHIYEFMDTSFSKKGRHEWSFYSITVRLIKRTTYISLSTFLGALLLFFGDFIVLTGAVAVFPPESGLVHHMYTKVKGNKFG